MPTPSPQSTTGPGAVEPCDPTRVSARPHTLPPRPSPHTLARAGGGLGTVRSPAGLETGHSGLSGPVVCSGDGYCDREPRPPEGAAAPTQPNPPPPPRPSERAYVRHRMFRCPPDRPPPPPPPARGIKRAMVSLGEGVEGLQQHGSLCRAAQGQECVLQV